MTRCSPLKIETDRLDAEILALRRRLNELLALRSAHVILSLRIPEAVDDGEQEGD